jgi:hypothetical protein
MKKLLVFALTIYLILSFAKVSFAQNRATPTSTVTQQQIDELQTKIASKVAQLKLVEKRGILGTVESVSDTYILLNDVNGNNKSIDVDELTKFYSTSNSFGISDVKKGNTLGILGLYNKDSRRILAREVNDISSLPLIAIGTVTNIDKGNYEISLKIENGKTYVFEIQDTTKTFIHTEDDLVKAGFSKLQLNQTVVASGNSDRGSSTKFLALKLIILPEFNLSLKLKPTDKPTVKPATQSGLKYFPQ